MDTTATRLLSRLQVGFPLSGRPFAALADELSMTEADVLARVRELQSEGLIRRLGPIIDVRRAGGQSTLAAVEAPADRLEETGRLISECEGVSHNYYREGKNAKLPFNVWFTVSASSGEALDERISGIAEKIGLPVRRLPMLRQFKIGVRFDLGQSKDVTRDRPRCKRSSSEEPPTGIEREVLVKLQDGLPLTVTPYADSAEALGIDEGELLGLLKGLLERGVIRRMGASLAHRKLGFSANAMAVWRLTDDELDDAGQRVAGFEEVSHCYSRPRLEGWPYNLYAMVHGRNEDECEAVIRRIESETGLSDAVIAYSRRQFKKTWSRLD